eukprot:637761-Rhodomonas_salina.2
MGTRQGTGGTSRPTLALAPKPNLDDDRPELRFAVIAAAAIVSSHLQQLPVGDEESSRGVLCRARKGILSKTSTCKTILTGELVLSFVQLTKVQVWYCLGNAVLLFTAGFIKLIVIPMLAVQMFCFKT